MERAISAAQAIDFVRRSPRKDHSLDHSTPATQGQKFIPTMEIFVILMGAAFVLSTTTLLVYQKDRRGIILERLHFRRRPDSGSGTPPRSLSPEKKRYQRISVPDYTTTFPPSRRSALAEIKLPATRVEAVTTSTSDWINRILPMKESYVNAADHLYTPCEFSIAEVKALGDFPDYATLSGVPLPQPYHDFDIRKARPRPYRPFRWSYHQTMCTFPYVYFNTSSHHECSTYQDGAPLVARAREHI